MSDDMITQAEATQRAELQYLMSGDLAGLTDAQVVHLYKLLCQSYGWDWLTRPFDLLPRAEGDKQTLRLYPNRVAASLLARDHGLTLEDRGERWDWDAGLYFAHARATGPGGRTYDDVGVVSIIYTDNATGEFRRYSPRYLADKVKIARTQANRRAVLGWCGLAKPDAESEMDGVGGVGPAVDIPQASERASEPRKLSDETQDTGGGAFLTAPATPASQGDTVAELRRQVGRYQAELRTLGVRYEPAPKPTGDAEKDLRQLRYYAATLGNLALDSRPAETGYMSF